MPDERHDRNQDPGRHHPGGKLPTPKIPPWFEKALVPILLVPAAFLPFFFENGDTFIQTCTQALAYIVMALGLNIVVGFAGLLDLGYVAFFAIGAYTAGYFGSGFFSKVGDGKGIHILVSGLRLEGPGHPRQLPDHPGAGGHHDLGRGHDHRPADAAIAR